MKLKPLSAVVFLAAPMLSAHATGLDDLTATLLSGDSSVLVALAGFGVMATIVRRCSR